MSIVHSARVSLNIRGFQSLTNGLQNGTVPIDVLEMFDLQNGTADGKCDCVYYGRASSVAATTTTSYDLVGAALLDIAGNAIVFAEVCLIAVRNLRTTALAYIQIGPHATNGFGKLASSKGFWGATADITNGGGNVVGPASSSSDRTSWHVMYDEVGVPCVAATSDILAVLTSGVAGSTNSWDLLIVGRSA